MNDRLREAIAVARSGETREAQLLVAAILESSPDNAQAWYLMSHLVESPARRAVYLYKAVSLDPYHERARAELAQFPPTVTDALSNSFQSTATTPLSVASPEEFLEAETDAYSRDRVIQDEVMENGTNQEVPEWLRPLAGETLQRQSIPRTTADEFAADISPSEAVSARPKRRQKRDGLMIAVLVILVVVTLAVLGLLGYLLFLQG